MANIIMPNDGGGLNMPKPVKVTIGKFKEDFEVRNCVEYEKIVGYSIVAPQCIKSEIIKYKIGDTILGGADSNQQFAFKGKNGNWFSVPISKLEISYKEIAKEEVSKFNNNPSSSIFGNTTQNLLVGGNALTAEDKFYEKLGIKYHNTHMFGVASRMKGRFYLAVVLVAGYFAYKKFKK